MNLWPGRINHIFHVESFNYIYRMSLSFLLVFTPTGRHMTHDARRPADAKAMRNGCRFRDFANAGERDVVEDQGGASFLCPRAPSVSAAFGTLASSTAMPVASAPRSNHSAASGQRG